MSMEAVEVLRLYGQPDVEQKKRVTVQCIDLVDDAVFGQVTSTVRFDQSLTQRFNVFVVRFGGSQWAHGHVIACLRPRL